MAVAMIGPKFYAWDRNGKPLAFGKLYTYQARTNTPKPTYQSEDQVVENTNPVILNGEGYANVYLDGSYKMVLKDDKDNEIWSSDPVTGAKADEWVNCFSAEYVDPNNFKVSGNQTDSYFKGKKVRIDNQEAEYSYSTVINSNYASGETSVTIVDAKVKTSIDSVCSSIVSPDSSFSKSDSAEISGATFKSIDDMKSGLTISGETIDLLDLKEGTKITWMGYNQLSDGGSNWGILRFGSHVEDGGSIFSIDSNVYVEANITHRFGIAKFGVFGDGTSADDTDGFERAIALRKEIKCKFKGEYNLKKIIPDGFTWIDFNYSLVNLIEDTDAPLFYDSRAGSSTEIFENFTVKNLLFNGNQELGNNAANANGGIWLSNWKNVTIENVEIYNCMRTGLNIRGCDGVKIHNYRYRDSGFDSAPTYSYGWVLEETGGNGKCRNIDMKNIKVDNCRGYGGHFNGCQKAVLKNFETISLNYVSSSISLTITSSNEIDITNYTANLTSGDSLEINDSTSVTVDNWTISNSGNRGIIFGDNKTGNDGSDVTIRNGQITGSTNADLALNRVKRLSFENMRLSKGDVSVIASEDLIRASDISFTNVEFNSDITSTLGGQYRFVFRNCSWLDIIAVDCSLTNDLWSSPKNNSDDEGYLIVPAGGSISLPPLSRLSRVRGPFIGDIRVTAAFSGNLDQCSLITYYLSKISSSLQITQGPEIYGSVTNRKMTVSQGATPDDLVLTNNTTVELRVVWALHTY